MIFVPIFNDSAHMHLTLADWDALAFSHIAVDALSFLIKPRLLFPKNVQTIFLDTSIRSCHKISGLNKKTESFNLYSPYDGQKISVNSQKLELLVKHFDNRVILVNEVNKPNEYEISDKAGQDAVKGHLYRSSVTDVAQIQDKQWANVVEPINKNCSCYTCQNFTLAYLHHLNKVGVLLATRLQVLHNLTMMSRIK